MPLQPPKLDDRTFESLFKEARSRIPRYAPEWTNWNDSDPGITLLQLQAWLAETILYRLNQLPDLNYIKFLQLLGGRQAPARPAQADLTFILKDKVDQPEVLIPQHTVVGVSAPNLDQPLRFETDRALRAISAKLALVVRLTEAGAREDVTEDNNAAGRAYWPFGESAKEGAALLLGLSSTLPFPRDEIGLQFYLAETGQALLAAPPEAACGATAPAEPWLAWECWDGVAWTALDLTGDESCGLARSGQVYFKVPAQLPSVEFDKLGLGDCAGTEEAPCYWLRVSVTREGAYPAGQAPRLEAVLTNVVRATAALTALDEAVGSSDGAPNQVMALRHAPVLAEPPLVLEVDEGSGPKEWRQAPDFYETTPHDEVYVLDRAAGRITFGDGRRGRIPVAGQLNVIARRYRHGGGAVGNVGAGTITELATPIPEVDSVTNHRAAVGGADEEPLDETKVREPRRLLKTRNRAVTLQDFAELAAETPGALVARAHAYASAVAGGARRICVVIVPSSEGPKPVPSEESLELVCRYLDERRLITTQVVVRGPTYVDLDLALDVRARDGADLKAVKNAIAARLGAYLHPLQGGEEGRGWPFGRNVYYSELVREIMLVPGVRRVESLALHKLLAVLDAEPTAAERAALIQAEKLLGAGDPSDDVIALVELPAGGGDPVKRFGVVAVYECSDMPIGEGALIALRHAEIEISYDRSQGA